MKYGRHASFLIAAAAGAATFAAASLVSPKFAPVAGANVFFLAYLVQSALLMRRLTPSFLRHHAKAEDPPAWLILAVTLGAVAAATGSLFLLINGVPAPGPVELTMALTSVTLGWATIHTMAAFHYAHVYWDATRREKEDGGLAFPETPAPGGYDFLYFSFVIGMTAQTSDTAITSTTMRKLNLLHSVVSYFFNAVIIAAAVNLAVSLGS
ncbi:DUF1345 domain-containing protein [Mesorhizobium sp. LHD-90]|uniref:DUF1345 domain-containing protein n=1 Tax=Mesorhizobium sp. LHD-90 TaxID=3071414 RepID=UPI0027E1A2E6|nr:DUF1345 domain-containing protein [Mesorhizobium sp. LHD-90]MDQ6438311.1 DUF1345 domain-containing protein [Mesorhizobium sp. LHD-90]